ncbi:unnamed protein product [Microthlaspi erraticum]|uniref:Uncharacterized protein n=1 Tax=Microthlaspi erraticum TaxID=1685480 RepID=A0A6D2K9Q9_9BRAS|nr:unnamed protein product [Microthlaspi erraticum]
MKRLKQSSFALLLMTSHKLTMKHADSKEWRKDMSEEIEMIEKNKTWKLVGMPEKKNNVIIREVEEKSRHEIMKSPKPPSLPEKSLKPSFFYGHCKPSRSRPVVVYGGLFSNRQSLSPIMVGYVVMKRLSDFLSLLERIGKVGYDYLTEIFRFLCAG